MSKNNLSIVESILFATGKPVKYKEIISFVKIKEKGLKESKLALDRLYRSSEGFDCDNNIDEEFSIALSSDLNTPLAISRLHELAKESNKGSKTAGQLLKSSSRLLGLLNYENSKWFIQNLEIDEQNIEKMISERNIARQERNFELADKIRDKLANMGISIEDSKNTTKWRVN